MFWNGLEYMTCWDLYIHVNQEDSYAKVFKKKLPLILVFPALAVIFAVPPSSMSAAVANLEVQFAR